MEHKKRMFRYILIVIVAVLCAIWTTAQDKELKKTPGEPAKGQEETLRQPTAQTETTAEDQQAEADAGTQPELLSISPLGGDEGSTITLVGKNLGNKKRDVEVRIELKEKKYLTKEYTKFPEPITPLYLSAPDTENIQILRFAIPESKQFSSKSIFFRKARIHVTVKGIPSNTVELKVVTPAWKLKAFVLTLVFLSALIGLFWLASRGAGIPKMLQDSATNTYSLSKCQAFAWTLVFIGGYIYLVVGKILFIGLKEIPDFNASLVQLMFISYGGMIAGGIINAHLSRNIVSQIKPKLSDLFFENGEISLNRFQLVSFTLVTIIIYIVFLYNTDIFTGGLPDIPTTLVALMLGSQGGYIAGKFSISKDPIVDRVELPDRKQDSGKLIPNSLFIKGRNFAQGIKVQVDKSPEFLDVEVLNPNVIRLTENKDVKLKDWNNLTLFSPRGTSFTVKNQPPAKPQG